MAGAYGVDDPSTGAVVAEVPDLAPVDALGVLSDVAGAQRSWAATPLGERSALLNRVAEALVDGVDDLARAITLETGKPGGEAAGEVRYAADYFRWFAAEALGLGGEHRMSPSGRNRILTSKVPVGTALLVTPWNFPLAMPARKVAAALAAGCTAVLKPAEQTPLSSVALRDVLVRCGLPEDVLGIVTTSSPAPVVASLLSDARVRKLSFTGSTEVGKLLMAAAAQRVVGVSLELGGAAPFFVLADADLDAAVEGAMVAKLRNAGQACTAANRFYVDRRVADDFTARLAARFAGVVVGPGAEAASEMGPLIDGDGLAKVERLTASAVGAGARVVTGGERTGGRGHFFPPTVLDGVPADAPVVHEEIFGPVAPVVRFDDGDDLAALGQSAYGLVAYVYTTDLTRGLALAEALECGMVGLNTGLVSDAAAPFGGVKESGIGREGGHEGLASYVETKYVAVPA